jgi:hypothetical protein
MRQGYPGNLIASVTYRLCEERLRLEILATADRPTVVNISNHAYFNLAGHGAGWEGLAQHTLQVDTETEMEMEMKMAECRLWLASTPLMTVTTCRPERSRLSSAPSTTSPPSGPWAGRCLVPGAGRATASTTALPPTDSLGASPHCPAPIA